MNTKKLDNNEPVILETMLAVRTKLREAEEYWKEAFNGNYANSPELSKIAMLIRNTDEAGLLKREALLASEQQTLNRLLILAHCPICVSSIL